MFLTQHGGLVERLAGARRGTPKEYVVSLARALDPGGAEARAFAAGGIALADGAHTQPAELAPHRSLPGVARVVLREGRYHQLRRMFAALGHEVLAIHRTAVGGLRLHDLGLAEGAWRRLSRGELRTLLHGSSGGEAVAAAGAS